MDKDKLKKKLAEWAGFKEGKEPRGIDDALAGYRFCWVYPDYSRHNYLPDFPNDLNACFKWLVPKLYSIIQVEEISFAKEHNQDLAMVLWWTGDHAVDTYGCGVYSAHAETLALALCLAIEKLIDSEVE